MKIIQTIIGIMALVAIVIFGMKFVEVGKENTVVNTPIDTVEVVATSTPQATSTSGWILSKPDARGLQFEYPEKIFAPYITAAEWPPVVKIVTSDYSCIEGERVVDGVSKNFKKYTVGAKEYCVGISSEGAAGSTYTTYEYSVKDGDFVTSLNFTLRYVQCMNYDEPNQSACKIEQSGFDIDRLADYIISSIRMK